MKIYGTIITRPEAPSTRKFYFAINRGKIVKRGQFVQVEVPHGKLVGRIIDVRKENLYYQNPETVVDVESQRPMDEVYATGEREYLIADVAALGIFTDGSFQDSLIPTSPGSQVLQPDKEVLENFFGLDNDCLYIGDFSHHDIKVLLNPTKLLQKHFAVLAMSGAGKSFLASNIIEELLDTKPEKQVAVIVIDTHGEYVSFAEDSGYSHKTRVFPIEEIKIAAKKLTARGIERLTQLSGVQTRELGKILRKLKSEKKEYSLNDIINAIEESEIKQTTKDPLLSAIDSLERTGLFDIHEKPDVKSLAKQGFLSVVDFYGTINMRKKQIVVAHLANELFNARKGGNIPPFLLVVEEAHQYIPEKLRKEEAIAKGIMHTIAREGRKFCASLCLISQRPVGLSNTVLSQCNTHIILRVTNPNDLDRIGSSSEGITRDVLDQITTLKVGYGIIVGEAVSAPLFVKIRKRRSKESERIKPLDKATEEYHKKQEQKKADAKSFM